MDSKNAVCFKVVQTQEQWLKREERFDSSQMETSQQFKLQMGYSFQEK